MKVNCKIRFTQPVSSELSKLDLDSMTQHFESKSSWLHFMICEEEEGRENEEKHSVLGYDFPDFQIPSIINFDNGLKLVGNIPKISQVYFYYATMSRNER